MNFKHTIIHDRNSIIRIILAAVFAIPASIAHLHLLHCLIFVGIFYPFFIGTKFLSTGPFTSIIIGFGIHGLAVGLLYGWHKLNLPLEHIHTIALIEIVIAGTMYAAYIQFF